MEMDYSLLGLSDEKDTTSAPASKATNVVADVEPPDHQEEQDHDKVQPDNEPEEIETEEEEDEEPEDESSDVEDFADPTLTERERGLLRRLEEVTGAKLTEEQGKNVPSETAPTSEQIVHNFLDGVELDDVLSSPERLNGLFVSVYNRALQDAGKLAAENIMRNLPATISTYVSQHITMNEMVNSFYERNPDLKGVKRTVASVANELGAKNPEWKTEKVFSETAKQVRQILRLQPPQKRDTEQSGRRNRSNFAKTSGRRPRVPELQGLVAEVNALISD